jgi:hypothetical protein
MSDGRIPRIDRFDLARRLLSFRLVVLHSTNQQHQLQPDCRRATNRPRSRDLISREIP